MKRLHIHIKTQDLDKSVGFYAALFGKGPDRLEPDYAKWLLDDPAANISLSTRTGAPGVDHVGVSLDARHELEAAAARLKSNGVELLQQNETTCCYAKSNKYWARDPQGAVWELFQTFGDSETYGQGPERERIPTPEQASACCAPA